MKTVNIVWLLALSLLMSVNLQAAPKYVQSPALSSVVKTPVKNVRGGQTVVPMITWGADIRTIYANGNSDVTTPKSLFGQLGLNLKLQREDVFSKQVENYLSGKTPYLRGTLGMINMAAETLNRDSRTKPVVIYQLSESAGGDALVVKSGIKRCKDLKGKTIALQAYGPHVDYLGQLLNDCGLSMTSVNLRWLKDLTGSDNTPMAAMYESNVDAAMVIIPDALALTSGGNVGTGSEDSVKGARILLSTKSANRVIADVYAVRADYFKSNRAKVEKFVSGLLKAQEQVANIVRQGNSHSEYKKTIQTSAKLLLDSRDAISDTEGLYADAYHTNYQDNIKFFTNNKYLRNFKKRNKSIQQTLIQANLMNGKTTIRHANWDYNKLRKGLTRTAKAETSQFDQDKVAKVVTKKQKQGTLSEGSLMEFEIFFKPNQKTFPSQLYQNDFERVIELASTYGGALITIEGHSDPLGFLRKKKAGSVDVVLRQIKQSGRNLSLTRANSVRDSIITFAKNKSITLDKSQFAVIGHGISNPKSGICGRDPCAPKTEKEWRDNMRVVFRLIQIEAEAEVFKPL